MSDSTRPDNLSDADVKPNRQLTDYERGFIDGIMTYAWHKDGVLWVGTTGKSLRRAMRDFMDEVKA